jgi:hypothetical protein
MVRGRTAYSKLFIRLSCPGETVLGGRTTFRLVDAVGISGAVVAMMRPRAYSRASGATECL